MKKFFKVLISVLCCFVLVLACAFTFTDVMYNAIAETSAVSVEVDDERIPYVEPLAYQNILVPVSITEYSNVDGQVVGNTTDYPLSFTTINGTHYCTFKYYIPFDGTYYFRYVTNGAALFTITLPNGSSYSTNQLSPSNVGLTGGSNGTAITVEKGFFEVEVSPATAFPNNNFMLYATISNLWDNYHVFDCPNYYVWKDYIPNQETLLSQPKIASIYLAGQSTNPLINNDPDTPFGTQPTLNLAPLGGVGGSPVSAYYVGDAYSFTRLISDGNPMLAYQRSRYRTIKIILDDFNAGLGSFTFYDGSNLPYDLLMQQNNSPISIAVVPDYGGVASGSITQLENHVYRINFGVQNDINYILIYVDIQSDLLSAYNVLPFGTIKISLTGRFDEQYSRGYNAGYDFGYDVGYHIGYEAAYQFWNAQSGGGFVNLISATIGAPVAVVKDFLSFEILGYNMLAFFSGLLTIFLVIKLVGVFRHGKG